MMTLKKRGHVHNNDDNEGINDDNDNDDEDINDDNVNDDNDDVTDCMIVRFTNLLRPEVSCDDTNHSHVQLQHETWQLSRRGTN